MNYTVSYPLDLVSQCLPHAAALLWALLCVCGASVVHSHPRDRLRKDIYALKQPFTTCYASGVLSLFKPQYVQTDRTHSGCVGRS